MSNIFTKIYKDSLLRNSVYLMTTNFSGLILGFLFWMIAAKYYTPNDIGIVSVILSSVSLISMISLIGFPMALMFYLPKNAKNANRMINSCLMVGIMISIIFSLIFILGLDMWSPSLVSTFDNLKYITIFIIVTIMTTVSTIISSAFTAGRRSSFHMVKENIFSIVKIFPLVLLIGSGTIGIFLSWSIGMVISVSIGFILLYKLWKYVPTFTFDPIIKDMMKFSFGNYIAGIFFNIPRSVFPLMIINFISADAAGYFFVAVTISGLLYGITSSITNSFLSESSDENTFWDNVDKVIVFNIILLVPILLSIVIFGKFVLNIFNPGYADNSFTSLIILAAASIPMSIVTVFNVVRYTQKRIMTAIKIDGIVAAISIILSIYFIGIWGIEGVAMAYLAANTIVATIIIFRMKNPIEFILRLAKYRNIGLFSAR